MDRMDTKQTPPADSADRATAGAGNTRRDFLLAGTAGVAGLTGSLAAGLNAPQAAAQTRASGDKRVAILADTQTHMMPALAREMARRNHDLVIGTAKDGLAAELAKLGAKVEVVSGVDDLSKPESVRTLVQRAVDRFGRFDSACIRPGAHKTGDILQATTEDSHAMYEGNLLSVFHALQALLPPLIKQGSGQVVINTSASGLRPAPAATLYSACRAGANMLVRCAALTAAPKGVTVNATGTFAMDYPDFIDDVGAKDPKVRRQVEATIPMNRFGKPEEAAHFVATLIDGVGTFQTGQFFSIGGGWAFE